MQPAAATSSSADFAGFGGTCAVLTGVAGFLYAVAFVIIARSAPAAGALLSALFLLAFGLLATAALVALYEALRPSGRGFALWALLLALVGALGAATHGAYDLAVALNPPATANADLPSQLDPRGFLTFGVSGMALLALTALMRRQGTWPRGLPELGMASAVLLILLYLARL